MDWCIYEGSGWHGQKSHNHPFWGTYLHERASSGSQPCLFSGRADTLESLKDAPDSK